MSVGIEPACRRCPPAPGPGPGGRARSAAAPTTRGTAIASGRPCWLSRTARLRPWRRTEAPYCFVPSVRQMGGLLGPARGPARLRSAPRARGAAAGGPRPGARPAPRRYAPLARGPGSGPLSAGARRRRRGPSPRRAGRHSPLRFTGPWARVWLSASPTSPLYCAACAWTCWARRVGRRRLAATFAWGLEGDVSRPPGPSPCWADAMGSGGGTCPPLSRSPAGRSDRPPRARRAAAGGSSPRRAARASPLCPRSVDWDGFKFSATPTRYPQCAARAWSRWARRAGSPQPPLRGREGDVSRPPGASSGRPVAAGGS
jgi:hypothetical protein